MDSVTVFEIADTGPTVFRHGSGFYAGLVVLVGLFGILSLWWGWRQQGFVKGIALWIGFMSLLWAVLWSVFILVGILPNRRSRLSLLDRYRAGEYQTVQGAVEVLRTQPAEGHSPPELIRVGDTTFKLNYFSSTPAYRQTVAYGGALQNGAFVRICHIGGRIVRVELGSKDGSTGTDSADAGL
jgi:hypothetical protein